MGFSLDEKHVRRAGLDYWKDLTLYMYESVEELYQNTRREIFGIFFKGAKELRSGGLFGGLFLVFGKETAGLPQGASGPECGRAVRIPMQSGQRCPNLSNAVCVWGVYEALRQNGYFHMK